MLPAKMLLFGSPTGHWSSWCAIDQIIITNEKRLRNRNSQVQFIVQAKVKMLVSYYVTKSPPVRQSPAAT